MATFKEWKRDFLKQKKWSKLLTIIAILGFLFMFYQNYSDNKKHQELIEGIRLIYEREQETEVASEIIDAKAEKTYEIAKNFNANFLIKNGYEKKGGMGTWITPAWEEQPQQKFYLMDFVGGLEKNRISVFITVENLLVCQILTSDGRKEDLSVSISSWKKDEPHLIIVQWQTEKDRVQLFIDKKEHIKAIPNLDFDVLGPILFMGIDFEGKFPASLRRGGPKISEGLKSIGLKEYKQN